MWQPKERIKHPLPLARWPSEQEAARALLYRPIAIGPTTAEQRTWVPAMVPWRATENGFVTSDVVDWYRRFAEGQPGVIVVEATGIRDIPSGPLLRIGDDRFIPGLQRLADAVRTASRGHTRLLIQCIDFLTIRRRIAPERYFARFFPLEQQHRERLAELLSEPELADPRLISDESVRVRLAQLPIETLTHILSRRQLEDLQFGYRDRVDDMHLEHIRALPQQLPQLFAAAAARAQSAGFDGVELHYAHAYTMASFLSRKNQRDDGYGGSRQHRLRLPLEIIEAVRERVGNGFALGVRFLGDEVIAGGSRIEDAVFYGVAFANAGVDVLSISKGGKFADAKQPKIGEAAYPYTGQSGYECMPTVYSDTRGPFGRNVPLAAEIRRAVRQAGHNPPIVAAGGISTFEQAEQILQAQYADIIAAARQSLADPDWFMKVRRGRGREVRRCTYTNYCDYRKQ